MEALPTFLVIGAAKSATTSLCHILGQHPEVFMCNPKEPNFFSHDQEYAKGIEYYNSLYRNASDAKAIGEGSPTYTYCGVYPDAANRIAEHTPRVKLIYIVRHPLERARSHWLQVVSNGHARPHPLSEGFRVSPRCIDASLYWTQVCAYRKHFSDKQFLFLFIEDFAKDPLDTLRKCFGFIGASVSHDMSAYLERKNTTRESFQDRYATRILRRIPSLSSAAMKLPIPIRAAARSAFRKKIDPHQAKWDRETWNWARSMIEGDANQFLRFVGKPENYWDLEWREDGGARQT